jgi:hypothetical protein
MNGKWTRSTADVINKESQNYTFASSVPLALSNWFPQRAGCPSINNAHSTLITSLFFLPLLADLFCNQLLKIRCRLRGRRTLYRLDRNIFNLLI